MLHMRSLLLAAALVLPSFALAQQTTLAPTPPMGWNSWDAYGTTITEESFRRNAQWIAKNLKPFGYEYVTIDEGWYESEPSAANPDEHLALDDHGRFIPAVDRFPSAANGAGFVPLADYIHSLGLKFGIHVLQGIPKKSVAANFPISGLQLSRQGRRQHRLLLPVGRQELRPPGQRRRPGLLRLHRPPLRQLARRPHQDRLHLPPAPTKARRSACSTRPS